jgi:hypothetical protein
LGKGRSFNRSVIAMDALAVTVDVHELLDPAPLPTDLL